VREVCEIRLGYGGSAVPKHQQGEVIRLRCAAHKRADGFNDQVAHRFARGEARALENGSEPRFPEHVVDGVLGFGDAIGKNQDVVTQMQLGLVRLKLGIGKESEREV
jgi:hypothetical protein